MARWGYRIVLKRRDLRAVAEKKRKGKRQNKRDVKEWHRKTGNVVHELAPKKLRDVNVIQLEEFLEERNIWGMDEIQTTSEMSDIVTTSSLGPTLR